MKGGERTVDVLMGKVVCGAPATSYDLWRKTHLHETSRQHSEHCGIDVIVAGSGLNAEQAAQTLVELAKKHYPDSPLARVSDWKAPVQHGRVKIEVARRVTNRLREELRPYVSGMQKYLKKPRTVDVIKKALWSGHIYRGKTAMSVSLVKAMEAISWTTDATQRILTFLYMFPEFRATPEGFVAGGVTRATNAQQAKAAVIEHGTPVRLLQLLFIELGVRLVIYNGSECRCVHVPDNWESLPERKRKTIVLNVWGNHVFTYDNPQARNPNVDKPYYVKSRVQTLMEVED